MKSEEDTTASFKYQRSGRQKIYLKLEEKTGAKEMAIHLFRLKNRRKEEWDSEWPFYWVTGRCVTDFWMCDQSTIVGTDVSDQGIPQRPLFQNSTDLEENDRLHGSVPAAGAQLLGKGLVGGLPSHGTCCFPSFPSCQNSAQLSWFCFLSPSKVCVTPFPPHLNPCPMDQLKLC